MERTTCCVVGGGPAGMVLGLLLARCGVPVTVLEKHGDFLRDFRGDTVHPTTLDLLDELGLAERFAQLPQRKIERLQGLVGPDGELLTLGDFTQLKIKHNYISMVPQWDFLDLLADEAATEPSFELRMNTEVTGFIRENGRINGVRYRTSSGGTGELRATITIACDGRHSLVRRIPELQLRDFPTPMDVRWFRLPRRPHDPSGGVALIREGAFNILIDRGDYYQMAWIIPKGTDAADRARPVDELNKTLIENIPWLGDGRELVTDWDDVKLLHVTLNRLQRWHVPGLLAIGDAAHAMSPVGGIGINLAVQDAVAAARLLAEPLRTGRLERRHVAAVQRRRWPATVLVQQLQRMAHDRVVGPALRGGIDLATATPPWLVRELARLPWLRRLPPYLIAYGAFRERPPAGALR
jgi:2-polyprenyl-6-methoxyphenol hydroxylase-like FAD-dependent oxidoreductase